MAPVRHDSVVMKISPERSVTNQRAGEEIAGKSERGKKTLHSDNMVGGGGPPCVGSPYGEGGMDPDTRVVP